jgi:hypothetical protein
MKQIEKYEGSYIKLSLWQVVKAERNTHLFAAFAFSIIGFAFVDAGYWDAIVPLFLAFIFFWLLGMAIMVFRHRKIYVLTETGRQAFDADELQEKNDLELKNERTREFFNQWYVRYPIGICMFCIAWWAWENPPARVTSEWVSLIMPIGFLIYGAILTKEISKFIIGIGLAYWFFTESIETVSKMSVSSAVVVGALIIAYAIYAKK